MTSAEVWAALAGAAVVQLLNTWRFWIKFAVMDTRVERMEKQLESVGHFRLNRDISGRVGS